MKILLKNLGSLPYSLDIGDWDYGAMVRPLLAPRDQPGDTVDIGGRVSPWDVNVQLYIRRLVVPDGATRIVTAVTDGYEVTAVPPGQLKVTFLEAPNDLVFLFFGAGTGDHKVKVTAADTVADFLSPSLVAGSGISLTILNPGADEQIRIDATGGSSAGSPLHFGSRLLGATATPRYLTPGYADMIGNVALVSDLVVPFGGTLKNLYVLHNVPGIGGLITYTVYVAGLATALAVGMLATATLGSNLINTALILPGSRVSILATKPALTAGPQYVQAVMELG